VCRARKVRRGREREGICAGEISVGVDELFYKGATVWKVYEK
jgi:hypothetical protein